MPRDSQRLLVGLHGAENRNALRLPKFQFLSLFGIRQESLLFGSDSTSLNCDEISIGWLAKNSSFNRGVMVFEAMKKVVQDRGYSETILVGHFAGVSTIYVGSKIENSRAISINGPSVASRYLPWGVNNLRKYAFPDTESVAEMVEKYADRLDLRTILESRVESSSFTFFINRKDQASFGRKPHFC